MFHDIPYIHIQSKDYLHKHNEAPHNTCILNFVPWPSISSMFTLGNLSVLCNAGYFSITVKPLELSASCFKTNSSSDMHYLLRMSYHINNHYIFFWCLFFYSPHSSIFILSLMSFHEFLHQQSFYTIIFSTINQV